MTVFQIVNYLVVLVAIIFLARYVYIVFLSDTYEPVEWKHRKKQGDIGRGLMKAKRQYPDKVRFYNWWLQAERLKKERIEGAYAELGVYKGESARLLHLLDPDRVFYLFDTFEGFTGEDLEKETGEAATYSTRNFADTSIEKVRRFVGGNEKVVFVPGYFPESTSEVPGLKQDTLRFALVNIDADLYNPIKAGLEYFYPRMSPGGVILVHDYNHKWEGAMKAVDEFLSGRPEYLVHVPDVDGTVMIIKS